MQATNMARSLQDFLLSRSDVPESVLNSCAVVGDYLERSFAYICNNGMSHVQQIPKLMYIQYFTILFQIF